MKDDGSRKDCVPDLPSIPEDPRVDDLIFYREGVETLMRLQSSKPVSNDQPDHAAILYEIFFKHAEKNIRILCRKLSTNVFGSPAVVDKAAWALKNNVRICAMIQHDEPENNEFVKLLKGSTGARILRAPSHVKDWRVNFAIMDEQSYRIEPNREDCKAEAVMYAPQFAKQLARTFDHLSLGVTLSAAEHSDQTAPAQAG